MAKTGFRIADAYVEIHTDTSSAKDEVRNLPREIGPDAEKTGHDIGKRVGKGLGDESDKQGKDSGDKISQGMNLAIIRNAPMIAAAVGGVLAAGAPVVLAGAGLLFGGLGALIAFQNNKVKQSFTGLWSDIKSGAQADAAAFVPVMVDVSQSIGRTFADLRPQLRQTFSDAAPLVQTFAAGIEQLARNTMPGLQRAVGAAGPSVSGLSHLLAATGTGLTGFFDSISAHSPAAGQAIAGLGDMVGNLLPILGELIGQGGELGAIILPALAGALGLVNTVVHALGPALPIMVAGFGGFRLATTAAGWLGQLTTKMDETAARGGMFSGTLTRASGGLSMLSSALPTLLVSLGILSTIWQNSSRQADDWSAALLKGGSAAAQATAQMDAQKNAGLGLSDVWNRMKFLTNDGIAQLQGYSGIQGKVTAQMREQLAAMDPLQRAQTLQSKAQADVNDAMDKYGAHSTITIGAVQRFNAASAETKRVQDEESLAIHGVTQAMIDQADEAMASIDASFAAQHAAIQQRDAENALKDAIRQHGAASNEAHDAQLNYNESIYRSAVAVATLKADQSGLTSGTVEYKKFLDSQLLGSLERMAGTLTGPARAAVDGYIATLKAAGVTTDATAGKVDNLGSKHAQPQVTLGGVPKTVGDISMLDGLLNLTDKKRPTPVADLNISQAKGHYDVMYGMLGTLGRQHPTPHADLIDNVTPLVYGAQRAINQMHGTTITNYINTLYSTSYARGNAGGGRIPSIHASTGKVVGPGTDTSDSVPAIGPDGGPWSLSANEFVVRAAIARAQGSNMDLLNAGKATIVPTGAANGGTPAAAAAGIHIEHIDVHLDGRFDFTDRAAMKKAASLFRDEIRDLERAYR